MIEGFSKNKLLTGIVIVSLLLMVCISIDYADNVTIENINGTVKQTNTTEVQILNNTQYVKGNSNESYFVAKSSDKIHIVKEKSKEKSKIPIITITSKPSCGCHYGYYWHTKSFVDYCPNCHRYNALVNKHKWPARFEQELTCKYCDCDWCGCCGKMKYSWSRTYLMEV